MIEIKCVTKDGILLSDVTPFQGNLKKRTQTDIDGLKASLKSEGLLMPFAVWKSEGVNYLLDGHGRLQALKQLAVDELDIMQSPFPCIYIEADTEDDARKALLQITSSYGKITKAGAKQFMVTIPDYVAPSVQKFVPGPVKPKKVVKTDEPVKLAFKMIKIRVPADKEQDIISVLKSVDYIEVL